MSFWQGSAVASNSLVGDHYLAQGLRVTDGALVAAGVGHAASGANALAGVSATGLIDYDQALTFSFFMPSDAGTPASTDYFAYSPDVAGGSGNTITLTAYNLLGEVMGSVSYLESGTFNSPLAISGVGQFHRVSVDQTLHNIWSGGIALDLISFGDLQSIAGQSVPEPAAIGLALIALVVGRVARRRASF